ncbi:MAG TPA: hypothetical protein PKN27_10250, partial [Propionibacteriaceae bacterium]|nr:hypothetical protein [Propionibacteriaceae bacterium]
PSALPPGGSSCSIQPMAPFHAGICAAVSRASADRAAEAGGVAGVDEAGGVTGVDVWSVTDVASAPHPTNVTSRATIAA